MLGREQQQMPKAMAASVGAKIHNLPQPFHNLRVDIGFTIVDEVW